MRRPPDIPTPEQNREKLRDDQFRVAIVQAIEKYFRKEIPNSDRHLISKRVLDIVKRWADTIESPYPDDQLPEADDE